MEKPSFAVGQRVYHRNDPKLGGNITKILGDSAYVKWDISSETELLYPLTDLASGSFAGRGLKLLSLRDRINLAHRLAQVEQSTMIHTRHIRAVSESTDPNRQPKPPAPLSTLAKPRQPAIPHKLSLDQAAEVRSRYKAGGWTYRTLAAEYGTNKTTIQDVITCRKAYRDY